MNKELGDTEQYEFYLDSRRKLMEKKVTANPDDYEMTRNSVWSMPSWRNVTMGWNWGGWEWIRYRSKNAIGEDRVRPWSWSRF
jgi:hypothetical protein